MVKDNAKTEPKKVKVNTTRRGGSWLQGEDGKLTPNDDHARRVEARAKEKAALLKKQNEKKG